MSKERFLNLVKNPVLLKAEDAPFLEELLQEFPFFQSAHLLAARCYKVSDSIHLQKQIKKAAAHITDRKVLYHLIENFEIAQSVQVDAIKKETPRELVPTEVIAPEVEVNLTEKQEKVIAIAETEDQVDKDIQAIVASSFVEEQIPAGLTQIEETAPQESSLVDKTIEVKTPIENNSESAAATIATIEAEIPLEREIKLALAESIYLREFEQNDLEKTEKGSKEPDNSIKSSQEIENSAKETENVKEVSNSNQKAEEPTDFVLWLKNLKSRQLKEVKPQAKDTEITPANKSEKLVEAFMEKPMQRAKPIKNEFFSPVNMAKQSVTDNDFFVTETLAKIYIKQGNLAKAIKVYQNLSLKNPEKNTFFAAQIKILKEQLHNKSGK